MNPRLAFSENLRALLSGVSLKDAAARIHARLPQRYSEVVTYKWLAKAAKHGVSRGQTSNADYLAAIAAEWKLPRPDSLFRANLKVVVQPQAELSDIAQIFDLLISNGRYGWLEELVMRLVDLETIESRVRKRKHDPIPDFVVPGPDDPPVETPKPKKREATHNTSYYRDPKGGF